MHITRSGILSCSWFFVVACADASEESLFATGAGEGIGIGDGDGDEDGDGDGGTLGDGDGDTSGDGDGDTSGDGDGDTSGDGDGDTSDDGDGGGEPVCGDGVMEGLEECDDGNDINDDACTNACTLPICGDGIIQAGEGETCDDGNDQSGDTCTASCINAGTVVWEKFYDFDNGMDHDEGLEVEIDADDNIDVLIESGSDYVIHEFDAEGNEMWSSDTILDFDEPNLAIGLDDQLAAGGFINSTGRTRVFDGEGALQWSDNVPYILSEIRGVAIDEDGFVISAGLENQDLNPSSSAVLMRTASDGATDWVVDVPGAGSFGPVAVHPSGQIYVWRETALQHYGTTGDLLWTSPELAPADYQELAVTSEGEVYLLAFNLVLGAGYTLHKFDGNGGPLWSKYYDDISEIEGGHGLAVLPGGGAIVAGFTNDFGIFARDGLITWYSADGSLLLEVVLDGPDEDDRETLLDVAVSPAGDYAVAVGSRSVDWGHSQAWIRKFSI